MVIKCPECGRQVSNKAPTCPTCGVEIAGKISRCENCGETYFTADRLCPNCHKTNGTGYRPVTVAPHIEDKPDAPDDPQDEDNHHAGRKGNRATLVVAVIFAIIVCGGLFYYYHQAQTDKEQEDYEFAMRSTDPDVLQSYLLRYGNAPQEHRDSVNIHLKLLQQGDMDWQNAVLSNSREKLQEYLDANPESVHRQEALNRIDSLDWLAAQKTNTAEALNDYLQQHADGRYVDDANLLLTKLKNSTVQPDERTMVTSVVQQFFQSINSNDEARLTNAVSMVMDTFLGKSNATTQDVIAFLHRLYKDGVVSMDWTVNSGSYKIQKQMLADDEFEYGVMFIVSQSVINTTGDVEEHTYTASATVSDDGKISGLNLTRLN